MAKKVILMICCFWTFGVFAQTKLDSLKTEFQSTRSDSMKAVLLYQIGKVYARSNPDSGKVYYTKSLELSKHIMDKRSEAYALIGLGYVSSNTNLFISGLKYYEEALSLFTEISDKEGISVAYNYIGFLHGSKQNYDVGLKHLRKSFHLATEVGYNVGITRSTTNIGGIYYKMGRLDSALYYHNFSLEHSLKTNDKLGISDGYNNIGIIHGENEEYEMASTYFRKSYELNKTQGQIIGEANALNNLGVVAKVRGNYAQAIDYYSESLALKESMNHTSGIGSSYNNIGEVYMLKEDYDLAVNSFEMAYKFYTKVKDTVRRAAVQGNIGEVYFEWAKMESKNERKRQVYLDKAALYGEFAVKVLEECGELERVIYGYGSLSEIYEEQGKIKKSLVAARKVTAFKDSLRKDERAKLFAEMELKYELEKHEEVLNKKKMELEMAQKEMSFQRLLLISGGIALLVVLFLLYKVFASNKDLRATQIVLKEKHESLLKAEEDLAEERKKALMGQSNDLYERISKVFEEQRPYLDKGFTTDKLAELVNSNRTYVSRVINTVTGKPFNKYINEFRIKEAIHIYGTPEGRQMTLEHIAYSVGFASKSTFNSAFKQYTGLTPSTYFKRTQKPSENAY